MERSKKPSAKLIWIVTAVVIVIAIAVGVFFLIRGQANSLKTEPVSEELELAIDDTLLNSISDDKTAKYCYTVGEGHKVLGWKESGDTVTVYCWAGAQSYSFVNGKLTDYGGTGWAAPVALTYTKNGDGSYSNGAISYPQDGDYEASLESLFPKQLWDSVKGEQPADIEEQEDAQATEWLANNNYKSSVVRSVDLKLTLLPDDSYFEEQQIKPYRDGNYPNYIGKRMIHVDGKDVVYGSYYYKDKGQYIFFKYQYGAKTCKALTYQMKDGEGSFLGEKEVKVSEFFK